MLRVLRVLWVRLQEAVIDVGEIYVAAVLYAWCLLTEDGPWCPVLAAGIYGLIQEHFNAVGVDSVANAGYLFLL